MLSPAQRLEECLTSRVVLVAIGRRGHGDDGAGPAVLDQVVGKIGARCIDAGTAPERHLGEAAEGGPEAILLVDAVDFGGAPGEIAVFGAEELPSRLATTHDASLQLVMRYLEGESGARVVLAGIQPACITPGEPLSASVEAGVRALSDLLQARLQVERETGPVATGAQPTEGRGS